MINIKKSKTADTRTCDFSKVTQKQLRESTGQHRDDVVLGLQFFKNMLNDAAITHDKDKFTDIEGFHRDFLTGFKKTEWWDKHRKITRHHLLQDDGVPEDVNLVDVLEMIVDCVMAGMGRSGSVYPLDISPEVLAAAFQNTVGLLTGEVVVEE